MTSPAPHPRSRLDELIHVPVRLSIVAALAGVDRMEFPYLRDLVEISDSLLSKHIGVLESAGYVEVAKGYLGKRPRTWLSLTETGRTAFRGYLEVLDEIVGRA